MASGKNFPLSITLRTIDRATPGFAKLGEQLKSVSTATDKIAKVSSRVGKTLATNLTLPIIAVGAASVSAMADFEKGMASVSTLVDTSAVDMKAWEAQVLAIGRRTPVSIGSLSDALYNVVSAGIDTADAMTVLEKSAQLGVAGLSSTNDAVNIVTSSINAFGLEGIKAANVYDVLFTAVKHGKTDLTKLGEGFGAVAGKMADAGIEFDEYISAVSALTTVGVPASQAHTQMRAAVDGLTKSSKPLSKIFKKIGTKDFKSLIKESGGVVPALARVREAVGGSESKMRALIGSSEGSAAAMSVTGGVFEAFTETLADMRDGISEVEKGFKKQSKTAAASWQKTKNSLVSAGVSIGKILTPALEGVADKLQSVSAWFESLDDDTKETLVTIAGVVAVVGPTLLVLGKLAGAISMVSKVIKVMSIAMAANPIAALAIVIGAAALSIYSNWETFEEFFSLLWGGVKSIFGDAWEYISGIVDKVIGAVKEVTEAPGKMLDALTGGGNVGDLMAKAKSKALLPVGGEFSPLGPALLPQTTGGAALASSSARTPAASGYEAGEAQVVVKFEGAPPGTRIDSQSKGLMLETDTGNLMDF